MSERETLYQQLPDQFSPKQMLVETERLNFKDWMQSRTWIQSVIDSWLFDNRIERQKRGIYRKLD